MTNKLLNRENVAFIMTVIFADAVMNLDFCQFHANNSNRVDLIGANTKTDNLFFFTIGTNYWFINYKNELTANESQSSARLGFVSEDREPSGSATLLSNRYSMTFFLKDKQNQKVVNGFFKVSHLLIGNIKTWDHFRHKTISLIYSTSKRVMKSSIARLVTTFGQMSLTIPSLPLIL